MEECEKAVPESVGYPGNDFGRTQEELFSFFTASLEMLCIIETDGCFKRVSPTLEKLLGYTQEELAFRPFIDVVHPEDASTLARAAELVRLGSAPSYSENRCRHKDGSYLWIEWTVFMVSPDGLMVTMARDITERKHMDRLKP
jgi:PAS domain S-box-containing protein